MVYISSLMYDPALEIKRGPRGHFYDLLKNGCVHDVGSGHNL